MSRANYLMVWDGIVVRGRQVGRALGVPTANILYRPGETKVPDGVYVADLLLLDQDCRVVQGVLNQGNHPTVPGGMPAIEIHLFDFNEDLYDQHVQVRYLEYIRAEIKFNSKDEMLLVMQEDIRYAKQWFKNHQEVC